MMKTPGGKGKRQILIAENWKISEKENSKPSVCCYVSDYILSNQVVKKFFAAVNRLHQNLWPSEAPVSY